MHSKLIIEFAAVPEDDNHEPCDAFILELHRVDRDTDGEPDLRVIGAVGVTASATREFYRGSFVHGGPNVPAGDVFIKLGYVGDIEEANGLRNEVSFYNNELKSLQGDIVPMCYGLYEGKHQDGDHILCLLLEHAGEPVSAARGFISLDMELRMDVMDAVSQLHLAGVAHNDLSSGNVLLLPTPNGRKPRIADFDHAEKHICRRQLEIIEGAPAPPRSLFGCPELWEFANKLGIWRSPYVKFFGLSIDENNIESPQVLVDSARRVATCVSQEEIEQRAKKAYDMVQLFKNNNGIRPRDFNPVDWVF